MSGKNKALERAIEISARLLLRQIEGGQLFVSLTGEETNAIATLMMNAAKAAGWEEPRRSQLYRELTQLCGEC
jgi:hypothetical protein